MTLLFIPVLALAVAAGAWRARYLFSRRGKAWNRSGLETSLISFFGFLLSFAFLLSGNLHRESTSLVHDQSAALAMLYREADLLPAADGVTLRASLRSILDLEVQVAHSTDALRDRLQTECGRSYDALWNLLSARANSTNALPAYRPALDLAQRSIALEYRLRFRETERAPTSFLVLLISGALLIGFLIGFTCASEGHGLLVPAGYVVLAGLTILVILDLNDPWHGFLRTSTQNFEQLQQAIGGG